METMLARCAGLDVHQETVEATVRVLEGDRARQQTRRAEGDESRLAGS